MTIFGDQWKEHTERLRQAWSEEISADDLVLIAGDISWAMREYEAVPDLAYIASLTGKKVLLKGNHDYWWSTKKKVQALAGPDCVVLQNDAIAADGFTIVGARGWDLPSSPRYTAEDERMYRKESERLRMSLVAGSKRGAPLIAMMHYPPLYSVDAKTAFTDLLEEYHVINCVYGHLHGHAQRARIEGNVRGVEYRLVAADYLDFRPLRLY